MSELEELENDVLIWQQNAKGALRMLQDERRKSKDLHKLIWAIVMKHGGEIALTDADRYVASDDWLLSSTRDMDGKLIVRATFRKAAELSV